MIPETPQLHFPSPYLRPSCPPSMARAIEMDDGARIATFVYGELEHGGEPVLMLHGNGEEHGIFGPTIDCIVDAGRAAIALDSRAQGKSTRGTARLTYELMAEDALACLDALGVGRVHILGFSDGAIEALLIARDHPERVASACALGANLTPEGVLDEGWDIQGTVDVNRAWCEHDFGDGVDASLLSPTPSEAREAADLLALMLEEPHIEAASLARIACPVSVVVGEFDCIRDDETVAIANAIPRSRLLVVPGMGHTLPKHAPDTVSAILLDTIAQAE